MAPLLQVREGGKLPSSLTECLQQPTYSFSDKVKSKMWALKKAVRSRSPRDAFSLRLWFTSPVSQMRIRGSRFMAPLSSLREKVQGFGAIGAARAAQRLVWLAGQEIKILLVSLSRQGHLASSGRLNMLRPGEQKSSHT